MSSVVVTLQKRSSQFCFTVEENKAKRIQTQASSTPKFMFIVLNDFLGTRLELSSLIPAPDTAQPPASGRFWVGWLNG